AVPAYATTAGGAAEDVEPAKRRKRGVSIFGGDGPPDAGAGEQLSRDEFQELVRDLDVDRPARPAPGAGGAGVAQKPRKARRPKPEQQAERPPEPEPKRDPAADLTPEDLVLKDDKPATPKRKRPRNRRHGRR